MRRVLAETVASSSTESGDGEGRESGGESDVTQQRRSEDRHAWR